MMNTLVHTIYCQQRLVRYNMFKDILRQLLKESLHSTLVEWVAHCLKFIGSIPEGDQKGHRDPQ